MVGRTLLPWRVGVTHILTMQSPKIVSPTEKLDCGMCGKHLEMISHYTYWSESEQDLFALCVPDYTDVIGADFHPESFVVVAKEILDGESLP